MSFDKLKNLFSRTFDSKEDQSLLSQASNFMNSNRRSIQSNATSQFQHYLASIPFEELRNLNKYTNKANRTASLRPQMVKRCYQSVPSFYFQKKYEITGQFFVGNRKETSQRSMTMHEQLDEVELCLFNQISSRFDQILSVLRTIQSLECVVVYNATRLGQTRKNNMQLVKKVSERHMTIVNLLKKKERIEAVLQKMNKIKVYQSFLSTDTANLQLQKSNSQHYQSILEIRNHRQLYITMDATKDFQDRVEQFEVNLKKSYSDTINDALFKYTVEIVNYSPSFWQKKFIGKAIFEDNEQDRGDGTVILDESVLIEQEGGGSSFNIKLSQQSQLKIVDNIKNGWREGQYSIGSIKAAFDKFTKEKHMRFLSDCRNFIFQNYLKEERKKIQNPSISNLLQQMKIFFCTKTFIYYADTYRTILTRSFSILNKTVDIFLKQSLTAVTIEEKEKIGIIVDGFFNLTQFLFKIIYDKILQVIQLKHLHESMDINDFKQIINLYQTEEDFIKKHLQKYIDFKVPETHLLYNIISTHIKKMDFDKVTLAKKEKVLSYLNKTHKFILQNQLKQSFENEIWQATDIPTFYYDSLHYLITGQSLNLRRNKNHHVRHNMSNNNFQSSVFIDRLGGKESFLQENNVIGNFRIIRSQIIIDNKVYKVTETLLLLMEIIEDYMQLAQFYPFTVSEVGVKIHELLKTYNISCNQLIILGGAVKLQKIKTKNITAKHLALNSLCLSFIIFIMSCINKRISIYEEEKIKRELQDQEERTIHKLKGILISKVNQGVGEINLNHTPTKGTQQIVNNTKTLYDILSEFYNKETLVKIFTKDNILTYLSKLKEMKIISKMQAESMKDDMNFYFHELKFLARIIPEFEKIRLEGEEIIKTKFQQL